MGPVTLGRSMKTSVRSDTTSFSGESRLKAVALPQLSGKVPALAKPPWFEPRKTFDEIGSLIPAKNVTYFPATNRKT